MRTFSVKNVTYLVAYLSFGRTFRNVCKKFYRKNSLSILRKELKELKETFFIYKRYRLSQYSRLSDGTKQIKRKTQISPQYVKHIFML